MISSAIELFFTENNFVGSVAIIYIFFVLKLVLLFYTVPIFCFNIASIYKDDQPEYWLQFLVPIYHH